jgi:hypothetical protein
MKRIEVNLPLCQTFQIFWANFSRNQVDGESAEMVRLKKSRRLFIVIGFACVNPCKTSLKFTIGDAIHQRLATCQDDN